MSQEQEDYAAVAAAAENTDAQEILEQDRGEEAAAEEAIPEATSDERIVGGKSNRDYGDEGEDARDGGAAPCPPADEAPVEAEDDDQVQGGEDVAGDEEADNLQLNEEFSDVVLNTEDLLKRLEEQQTEAGNTQTRLRKELAEKSDVITALNADLASKNKSLADFEAFKQEMEKTLVGVRSSSTTDSAREDGSNKKLSALLALSKQEHAKTLEENRSLTTKIEELQSECFSSKAAQDQLVAEQSSLQKQIAHWKGLCSKRVQESRAAAIAATGKIELPEKMDTTALRTGTQENLATVRNTITKFINLIKSDEKSFLDNKHRLIQWMQESTKERESLINSSTEKQIEVLDLQHQLASSRAQLLEMQQLAQTGELPLTIQHATILRLREESKGRLSKQESDELKTRNQALEKMLEAATLSLAATFSGSAAEGQPPQKQLQAVLRDSEAKRKVLEAEIEALKASSDESSSAQTSVATLTALCQNQEKQIADLMQHLAEASTIVVIGEEESSSSSSYSPAVTLETTFLKKQLEASAQHNAHLQAENDTLRSLCDISEEFHRCLVTNFHDSSAEEAVAKVRKSWKDTYSGHQKKMEQSMNEARKKYETIAVDLSSLYQGEMENLTKMINEKEKLLAWRLNFSLTVAREAHAFINAHFLGAQASQQQQEELAALQKELQDNLDKIAKLSLPETALVRQPQLTLQSVPLADVEAHVTAKLDRFKKTLVTMKEQVTTKIEQGNRTISYYRDTERSKLVTQLQDVEGKVSALEQELVSSRMEQQGSKQAAAQALQEATNQLQARIRQMEETHQSEVLAIQKEMTEIKSAKKNTDQQLSTFAQEKTALESKLESQAASLADESQKRQEAEQAKEKTIKQNKQLEEIANMMATKNKQLQQQLVQQQQQAQQAASQGPGQPQQPLRNEVPQAEEEETHISPLEGEQQNQIEEEEELNAVPGEQDEGVDEEEEEIAEEEEEEELEAEDPAFYEGDGGEGEISHQNVEVEEGQAAQGGEEVEQRIEEDEQAIQNEEVEPEGENENGGGEQDEEEEEDTGFGGDAW